MIINNNKELDSVCEEIFSYVVESGDLDFIDGFIDNFEETFVNEECFNSLQEASITDKAAAGIYGFAKRNPKKTSIAHVTVLGPGQHVGTVFGGPLGWGAGLAYDIHTARKMFKHLKKQSMTKPKTWIAKKIQSLRKVYAKWMDLAKVERYRGKAGIIKRACLKLAEVIDFLLRKLQNATDNK